MQDLIRKQRGGSRRVGTAVAIPQCDDRYHPGTPSRSRSPSTRNALVPRPARVLLQIHDPTTKNRQGGDVGSDYRSAIFYLTDEQHRVAEDTIADVDASGLWPGKVVTEVTPAGPFWEAEPEHQDYLEKYPAGYTATSSGRSGSSRAVPTQ